MSSKSAPYPNAVVYTSCNHTLEAMAAQHPCSRAWSSSTLLRGFGLLDKQRSMSLSHIHDVCEQDLEKMREELAELEAPDLSLSVVL